MQSHCHTRSTMTKKVAWILHVLLSAIFAQECIEDEECVDIDESCLPRSLAGNCILYGAGACRKSCWKCVNATELRLEGVSEEEL